jgi:hypothetical protein
MAKELNSFPFWKCFLALSHQVSKQSVLSGVTCDVHHSQTQLKVVTSDIFIAAYDLSKKRKLLWKILQMHFEMTHWNTMHKFNWKQDGHEEKNDAGIHLVLSKVP